MHPSYYGIHPPPSALSRSSKVSAPFTILRLVEGILSSSTTSTCWTVSLSLVLFVSAAVRMESHPSSSPESLDPPAYLQTSPPPSPVRMSKISPSKSSPSRPKTRFDNFPTHKPNVNKYRDNRATSPSVASDLDNVSPSSSFKLPPPAVTSYIYTPSSSPYATQRSPLHSLQRQTEILTEELQHLLDVQSAELMSGGSLSTSRRLPRNPLYSADQVPRGQRITLHQARKRVLLTMRELAEVKGKEEKVYTSEVAERETLVKTMKSWGEKASRLENEIRRIEEGEEGREAQAVREAKSEVEVFASPHNYLIHC